MLYDVYTPDMYLCIPSVAISAAALSVDVMLLLLQPLLLAAAVRHRVTDGQICCWFIESDSSGFSLHSNTIYF